MKNLPNIKLYLIGLDLGFFKIHFEHLCNYLLSFKESYCRYFEKSNDLGWMSEKNVKAQILHLTTS